MIGDSSFEKFERQAVNLRAVVVESNQRLMREPADQLFYDYTNVFVKAYIVSACSILEAFLQDILMEYVEVIKERVRGSNIPYNLILWGTPIDVKETAWEFKAYEISINRSHIADVLSGNFYKTIKAFRRAGLNLESSEEFRRFKDFVSACVNKRNSIVHHNDSASDMSFDDVISMIDEFVDYGRIVHAIVRGSPHSLARTHIEIVSEGENARVQTEQSMPPAG